MKNKPDKRLSLPDLLNYGAMVADGVLLNKDGSLTGGFFYKGRDLGSATNEELEYTSAVVNSALARLGNEWMMHIDALRLESNRYPAAKESYFPDVISAAIDEERRRQFHAKDRHFESIFVIIFTYLPPKTATRKASDLMFQGGVNMEDTPQKIINNFEQSLNEIQDYLSSVLFLERLKGVRYIDSSGKEHINDLLLQYLHYTLTGINHPINLPPIPMYLDAVIGGYDFWTGVTPKVDEKLIQVVAIDGFPQESYPCMFDALNQISISYRWSTRFIFLDAVDAQAGMAAFRRKWEQKVRGFVSQLFHPEQRANETINQDAVRMVSESDEALASSHSGLVAYGYYTSVIVLMGDDPASLYEQSRILRKAINNLGFSARIETINAVEAFLGSLPAHSKPNIRRPMLNTLNLADMIPLSSVWAGREYAPCPFYPDDSPALLYAATEGSTPFRFNLHIGDLGHTLILGPTGSGKSTLLALIAAQFRRYPDATVFAFDKGRSLEPLTYAIQGSHFTIVAKDAESKGINFAPLAGIADPVELGFAEDWVETLLKLQDINITPTQRNELHRALISLAHADIPKTLTSLQIEVQDRDIKEALNDYTLSGNLGSLLDAEQDNISVDNWSCFEIEELMNRNDRARLPVLLYLFHVVERRMKGQPCLLILDEAWLMLGNKVFREKIREWLKVLRKANCAVVLATQSISDASGSGILDVLAESCPTKIFLANREASREDSIPLYKGLGCNIAEIEIISNMTPKRQYYVTGEGRRLIDFNMGKVALSFVGASGKEDLARIVNLRKAYNDEWPKYWLQERGINLEDYTYEEVI